MSQSWPPAERPDAGAVNRREAVVRAAVAGDVVAVRGAVDDEDGRVRASSLRGLATLDELDAALIRDAAGDPDPLVRRTLAELAAAGVDADLAALLTDADSTVVETACWATGELGPAGEPHVDRLVRIVSDHDDALCREAAVAALGAIGVETGLDAILAATTDKATVRRRAILALAPFTGPRVNQALETALTDRDWQVRQAAEDLLAAAED